MGSEHGEQLSSHRTPGRHARAIVLRLRMRTLLTLGALATVTTLTGRAFGLRSPLFMGSEVALLLCILLVYRYVLPLVDRHDRGASGEELVGGVLEELPGPHWRVLHDVVLGRGNVDHVVIGPPGVFAVETKSHPGPIRVDRLHGALLRQARSQQSLLEGALEVPVEPLVVYSRAWVDRPLARRKGVRILPARMLARHLVGRQPQLSASEVEALQRRLLEAIAQSQPGAGGSACGGRPRMPAGARGSVPRRVRDRARHT